MVEFTETYDIKRTSMRIMLDGERLSDGSLKLTATIYRLKSMLYKTLYTSLTKIIKPLSFFKKVFGISEEKSVQRMIAKFKKEVERETEYGNAVVYKNSRRSDEERETIPQPRRKPRVAPDFNPNEKPKMVRHELDLTNTHGLM